jgi:hypothetical protein
MTTTPPPSPKEAHPTFDNYADCLDYFRELDDVFGGTTLEQLERWTRVLAKQCFVKVFVQWGNSEQPWLMGFCAIDGNGQNAQLREEDLGDNWCKQCLDDGLLIYLWERVDELGQPWAGMHNLLKQSEIVPAQQEKR